MAFIVKKELDGSYIFDFIKNGNNVGYAKINPLKQYNWKNKNVFMLKKIKIEKEFQKKGYGSEFLSDIKNYIKYLKSVLILDAVPENISENALVKFYLKNGFDNYRDDFFLEESIITQSQNEKCAFWFNY